MRRRLTHTPYFIVLFLILTLTLSFIAVLSAKSLSATANPDTGKIVSMLELLRSNVTALDNEAFGNTASAKGRKTALENKISAVIHQIEAGALSGSLNKLQNDVNKTVTEWILPYSPQDADILFEMILEIMELIKGELPPPPPLKPEASFVFTPETPLAGETVTFDASASEDPDGTIVSYRWNFGDGTVTTESDPVATHIYATYGIYRVSLTVTDDDSLTDTESKPVKVIAPPTAYFTYLPHVPVVNEIIIFDASGSASNGGEIESYMWDFDDGFTKTGEIVTHAYSTEGTYSVVLNVTDSEGLWDTCTADITVYALPVVDFPPKIIGVFRVPEEPNYDEYVRILASVIDIEGEVESVILGYSINRIDWINQTMTFDEDIEFYSVEIPPQPYDTTVDYKVYASDNMGNWSVSRTYNYTVVDKYSPIVEIEEPTEGGYLRGLVSITVSVQEDYLVEARLAINGRVVSSWQDGGKHVFAWNTLSSDYPDGTYIIELNASDKANNSAEETVTVTVDNTLPTATVNAPSEGAFLRGTVIIEITGEDVNLDKMKLKINDSVIETWSTGGTHAYPWNTRSRPDSDGTYRITLTVYDKAGNSKETSITTVLDNTLPEIEAPKWKPEEPYIDEQVNITVQVSDSLPSSGIQNVTLWYKNATMDDWQPIPMSLNVTSGNWTASIPAQSAETTIRFYIEAFDNAGNKAETDDYEYNVIAPAGIPLAWILAIILLILVATATAIYFWRKRRKEKQGISSRA